MNLLSALQIIIFTIGTFFLILISKKPLRSYKAHGFYRFFVFEFALALVLLNFPFWFTNPFSSQQMLSWILLLISIYFLLESVYMLKMTGGSKRRENNSANFNFENTTNLVKEGVYKYVRHPMYSSILFLCLGTLFKNLSVLTILLTSFAILFLILTAKVEEKENISFFGNSYSEYMKATKMFVPFIF